MNKKYLVLILKTLYVGLAGVLLAGALITMPGNPDAGIIALVLLGAMAILSFPTGLLVLLTMLAVTALMNYTLSAPIRAHNLNAPVDAAMLLLSWLGFLLVGYYQWFKLVPRMWARRAAGDPEKRGDPDHV
jgi:hypothetical protein